MANNPDFDLYQLSDEHSELRAAVRCSRAGKDCSACSGN